MLSFSAGLLISVPVLLLAAPPGGALSPATPQWADEADEAPPRPPTAGESLVDVRVEGNTTIPAEHIAKYIKTRPGRPVTRRQIDDDVKSLYGTRWFFSVEPRYRRTDEGLVLVFRVLERPVVQRVEYKGNEKIKTKHLSAQTGLKPGSPFDVSANREAARKLEAHYHEKGHAFATIELEKGGHESDREVVFRIHEGPVVRVTSVKFNGNEFFSNALLATKLRTKKAILWRFGGLYDPATIPDDVAALKQYYHSLGFFDVKIDHKLAFNKDKSSARIEYLIEEGPRYKVRNVVIAGNRVFSEPELRKEITVAEGEFFSARKLLQDVDRIKEKYGELGRIYARIDAKTAYLQEPGVADLVYEIDEDRVYYIRRVDVVFRGENPHTKRSVVLNTLEIRPGDLADPKKIRRSKSRLGGLQVFERGPQDGPEIILKRVMPEELGVPDELRAVRGQSEEIRGQRSELRSQTTRLAATRRGARPSGVRGTKPTGSAPWDVSQRASEVRTQISDLKSQRSATRNSGIDDRLGGYRVAQTTQTTDGRQRTTSKSPLLAQHATRRNPLDPANLNPDGTPRQSVAARQEADRLPFAETAPPAFYVRQPERFAPRPGTTIRAQNFEGGIEQPGNPLFNDSPQGDPLQGDFRELPPAPLDIEAVVTEARTGRLMFGVGVNSDAGLVGSIILSEMNFDLFRPPMSVDDIVNGRAFRGGGQRFRMEAVPGNIVSRYLVSWTDPYIFNTDYSLSVSGFYYNRFFEDWDERRGGGRVAVGRQLSPALSVSGTLRLEEVRITDPDFPTPPILAQALGSNFLSTAGVSVAHDTRDSAFLPGMGHFAELAYEQAFGDFDYPRATAEARQYFTLFTRPDGGGRHILQVGGQLGWTDVNTPIFERFYAGGFQTFRGFDFRGVTPRQFGVEIGGRWMAIGTVEYMLPLMANEMVQGVVFSDFGTVEEEVSLDDFRVTAGFGFRLTVPAMGPVPLAFDFAWPIISQDFDDERVFSFYVGLTR